MTFPNPRTSALKQLGWEPTLGSIVVVHTAEGWARARVVRRSSRIVRDKDDHGIFSALEVETVEVALLPYGPRVSYPVGEVYAEEDPQ